MLKRYVHGIGSDDPLVSYDGSGTTNPTYLLADERGSIMAETNSSGLVTTKHQYGPYGEPMNQSASRFRYTGQILLPGTELYHYKARVYHPKLGRFLQTDPIGYKDGMNWYGNHPNLTTGGKDAKGSEVRPTYVGMAHELGHARAYDIGTESEDMQLRPDGTGVPNTTPPGEVHSMANENMVRAEHGLTPRAYYYTE